MRIHIGVAGPDNHTVWPVTFYPFRQIVPAALGAELLQQLDLVDVGIRLQLVQDLPKVDSLHQRFTTGANHYEYSGPFTGNINQGLFLRRFQCQPAARCMDEPGRGECRGRSLNDRIADIF